MDNIFTAPGRWMADHNFIAADQATAASVLVVVLVIALLGVWAWYADTMWTRYSLSNKRSDRNEMIVAFLAPVAVPAIFIVAGIKAYNTRNARTA